MVNLTKVNSLHETGVAWFRHLVVSEYTAMSDNDNTMNEESGTGHDALGDVEAVGVVNDVGLGVVDDKVLGARFREEVIACCPELFKGSSFACVC